MNFHLHPHLNLSPSLVRNGFFFLLTALLLGLCISINSSAQVIDWQKALGGTSTEQAQATCALPDGSYIMAGYTFSTDGDVSGNHDNYDVWVVKLDNQGNIVWQKTYGGTEVDRANAIIAVDGGYVLTGYTYSNTTGSDVLAIKLDESGNLIWQKTFGGTGEDLSYAMTVDSGGDFVLAGTTTSHDGDVSGTHDHYDVWVVKVGSAGNLIWQKALGGSAFDFANAITTAPDGGYLVAGNTSSMDGDVSGLHGNAADAWVFKLNGSGNLVWQKTYGGTSSENAKAIASTADGNYVFAGSAESNDGDLSGSRGLGDVWVVKLNSLGNLIWQKALGGSAYDEANALVRTLNGNYVLAGLTGSANGDVTGNHGQEDAWVIKLNEFSLQLINPAYTCSTGELTFQTAGGNGSPIEFQAIGLTPWTTVPTHTLEVGVRLDPNSQPLLLMARQSGHIVTRSFDFRAFCNGANQAPVFNGPLPNQYGIYFSYFSYQLPSGIFTDPEGEALSFSASGLPPGLSLDHASHVISGYPNEPGAYTAFIKATDPQGASVEGQILFSITTHETAGVLQLLPPLYNCTTGQLDFQTVGGNGSPIEFQAVGVTSWTTIPSQFIEAGVRLDLNSQPLVLMARQNDFIAYRTFDFRGYCSQSARMASEIVEGLQVRILGNPVEGQKLTIEVTGVEGQAVRLQLVDMNGRVVTEKHLTKASNLERLSLLLPPGRGELVLLHVFTPTQRQTQKVLLNP